MGVRTPKNAQFYRVCKSGSFLFPKPIFDPFLSKKSEKFSRSSRSLKGVSAWPLFRKIFDANYTITSEKADFFVKKMHFFCKFFPEKIHFFPDFSGFWPGVPPTPLGKPHLSGGGPIFPENSGLFIDILVFMQKSVHLFTFHKKWYIFRTSIRTIINDVKLHAPSRTGGPYRTRKPIYAFFILQKWGNLHPTIIFGVARKLTWG